MTIWIEHDGGLNPVREGETLVAYRLRNGMENASSVGAAGSYTWQYEKCYPHHYQITHYAVTPPRATITPPAPMDAAEVLVRAREAAVEVMECGDYMRRRTPEQSTILRAILTFHRDLSRPLSEVAPYAVEDADERAVYALYVERFKPHDYPFEQRAQSTAYKDMLAAYRAGKAAR